MDSLMNQDIFNTNIKLEFNMKPIKRKGAAYIRVSTAEQVKEGLSIEAQKSAIIRYANSHNAAISEFYVDAGYSGSNTKRPAFQRMMLDIKNRKFRVLFVYKIDRLNRNLSDLLKTIKTITANNIDFISITQDIINTSTAAGMFMLNILGVFAQFERDTTIERIKTALEYREQIREIYFKPPIGYKYIKEGHHTKIIIDEEKAKLVKELFFYKAVKHIPVRKLEFKYAMDRRLLYYIWHNPFYIQFVNFKKRLYYVPQIPRFIPYKRWFGAVNSNKAIFMATPKRDVNNEVLQSLNAEITKKSSSKITYI